MLGDLAIAWNPAVVAGLNCALLTILSQISSEKESTRFLEVFFLNGVTHTNGADTLGGGWAEGTAVTATAPQNPASG